MDNNPFRSQQPQSQYSQQFPQQQQQYHQPIQGGNLYQTPPNLQQQQQQPNFNNDMYQNSSLQQNWPQQQGVNTYSSPPVSQFTHYNNTQLSAPASFDHNNGTNNGFMPYSQPQNPIIPATTGYLQQQQQQMPMPYYPQQYGNTPLSGTDPSNLYIPPNFGMSTTATTTPSYQPKHAPVDASTLLKGTQIRRIACPVCQKMLEGDDMAINHHVNEHYN